MWEICAILLQLKVFFLISNRKWSEKWSTNICHTPHPVVRLYSFFIDDSLQLELLHELQLINLLQWIEIFPNTVQISIKAARPIVSPFFRFYCWAGLWGLSGHFWPLADSSLGHLSSFSNIISVIGSESSFLHFARQDQLSSALLLLLGLLSTVTGFNSAQSQSIVHKIVPKMTLK